MVDEAHNGRTAAAAAGIQCGTFLGNYYYISALKGAAQKTA